MTQFQQNKSEEGRMQGGRNISRDGSTKFNLSFDDSTFRKKQLMISDYPCFEKQADLDIFVAYGIISQLRTFFVPCVDCNACFQEEKTLENKCRYPSAQFYQRGNNETGVKSLGEPTSFVTGAGRGRENVVKLVKKGQMEMFKTKGA